MYMIIYTYFDLYITWVFDINYYEYYKNRFKKFFMTIEINFNKMEKKNLVN